MPIAEEGGGDGGGLRLGDGEINYVRQLIRPGEDLESNYV